MRKNLPTLSLSFFLSSFATSFSANHASKRRRDKSRGHAEETGKPSWLVGAAIARHMSLCLYLWVPKQEDVVIFVSSSSARKELADGPEMHVRL